ncbi:MAG: nitrous oxide reductase accessory protein NosL [Magnetococcales bacterium]|nr:nitrous oxide reductase accessory protein NosL [Magnetococcales bacterium]
MIIRAFWLLWLILALEIWPGNALSGSPPTDQAVPAGAKCPVCGMFVAKYPEWVALIVWQNHDVSHFDGAKDLMRFLLHPERHPSGQDRSQIANLYVTEYYGLKRIPARLAWYVTGSDVHGPMGHELIPLANEQDAQEFMRDHAGRTILRFDQITPQILSTLESSGATP